MGEKKLLIIVVDNGNQYQIQDTCQSLECQSNQNFEQKTISCMDFWSKKRVRHILDRNDAEYVMFLYSGSVLEPSAIDHFMKCIKRNEPAWFYCDERTFDAKFNGHLSGYLEKPGFGEIGFANYLYTGEAVVFSKNILEKLNLEYEGKNFRVALLEMTILAAAKMDGAHIAENLLVHHKRREISEREQALLSEKLKQFTEERSLSIAAFLNRDAAAAGTYPLTVLPEKVSFVILADQISAENKEKWLDQQSSYEIIIESGNASYAKKCIAGAKKASGDVLCFVQEHCAVPKKWEMETLLGYLQLEKTGIVSPCLKAENGAAIYAGAPTIGQEMCTVPKMDRGLPMKLDYSMGTREISVPAWQFWMVRKKDFLAVADTKEELSPNYRIADYAFELEQLGKKNLFCGEVVIYCQEDQSPQCDIGFYTMLSKWKKRFAEDPYFTTGMRAKAYQYQNRNSAVYWPSEEEKVQIGEGKKVLVMSHELSMTGAPIVLSYAVRIMKEAGWQIVVLSPKDGVLRNTFLAEQVPVMVRETVMEDDSWLQYAKDFDLIIVNTIVPYPCIAQLKDFSVPVIWWLHDARGGYEAHLKNVLPDTLGKNIHTLCVSHYAQAVVNEFRPQYETDLLLYGLEDVACDRDEIPELIKDLGQRKLFVSVGTVEKRKGQDVLAQAIRLLPEEIRKQSLFLIIGKCVDREIMEKVNELYEDYPEDVRLTSFVKHEEIFEIYKQAAAVICSSRDDPLPTFMTETMMQSGICICSEFTGTAGLIKHGENGFLYKNNDPAELAKCICYISEHGECLDKIRTEARKVYEEVFSLEVFKKNLLNYTESIRKKTEGEMDDGR